LKKTKKIFKKNLQVFTKNRNSNKGRYDVNNRRMKKKNRYEINQQNRKTDNIILQFSNKQYIE